jgi:hypothetical protein
MVRLRTHFYSQERQMKKTVLTFGLISGAVSSVMMVATLPFAHKIGFNKALIVGYTSIILAFLLVFFGIRSYRDNVGNGHITFGKAFAVGICITLISCAFYVATWQVLYFNFMPDFLDEYNTQAVEKLRASGATAAAIDAQLQEMKKFRELYQNPFFNAAVTLIEPLPVGLVITLLSAGILKKRPPSQAAQPAAS